MKYSKLFAKTFKDTPKDEVSTNAKLLLRGGFIDKLMSGSYTLLPLGLRVVKKIEQIIREEINSTGAQEILMPLLHPKSVWNETGRWDTASEVMYQLKKDDKEYALSFTHEEIALDLVRKHAQAYKDYPIKFYHFSTKFRDELRAKSGILRGREFIMKDLYSLHTSKEDFEKYYEEVKKVYLKIFERLGLRAIITEAGGGVFTKNVTHEFQVLCGAGEDEIVLNLDGKTAKNVELLKDSPSLKASAKRAIEVGNIFGFGQEYCKKMNVVYTDKNGKTEYPYLGSYGIGLTRAVGAIVETHHDSKGIIWPENIAPFKVHLLEISNLKSQISNIYNKLQEAGVEVLWDDREEVSVGQKFADADLIGIPVRLVVSKKTGSKVEFKKRNEERPELISLEEVVKRVKS